MYTIIAHSRGRTSVLTNCNIGRNNEYRNRKGKVLFNSGRCSNSNSGHGEMKFGSTNSNICRTYNGSEMVEPCVNIPLETLHDGDMKFETYGDGHCDFTSSALLSPSDYKLTYNCASGGDFSFFSSVPVLGSNTLSEEQHHWEKKLHPFSNLITQQMDYSVVTELSSTAARQISKTQGEEASSKPALQAGNNFWLCSVTNNTRNTKLFRSFSWSTVPLSTLAIGMAATIRDIFTAVLYIGVNMLLAYNSAALSNLTRIQRTYVGLRRPDKH